MWGNLGTISQYAAQQYTITVDLNDIKLLRRRRNFSRLQRIGDVRRRRSLNRLLNWSKLTPFGPFQVQKTVHFQKQYLYIELTDAAPLRGEFAWGCADFRSWRAGSGHQ